MKWLQCTRNFNATLLLYRVKNQDLDRAPRKSKFQNRQMLKKNRFAKREGGCLREFQTQDYNWQGNLGAPLWDFLEPVNTIRNKTADVFTDLEMNKLPWLIRVTWCHKALKIKSRVQREGSVGKIACHQLRWPKLSYWYSISTKATLTLNLYLCIGDLSRSSTCMLGTFEMLVSCHMGLRI